MSNKVKKTMIGVCAALCVGALIGAGSTSAKAENGESAVASFVQSSCYYGSDWQGHYGSKGYVLPTERTDRVYSDMYEGKSGDEYIAMKKVGLKADAPVSSFGVVCNNWVYATDNSSTKWNSLYKPNADTTTIEDTDFARPRITDASATIKNISATFELKTAGYVTAYVYSYDRQITPTNRASVRLYAGAATEHSTTLQTFSELDEKNGGAAIAISDVYYTDTGAANATQQGDISRQGSYVTFKIEQAGAYTLTAASAGKQSVIIGGVFFDEENRNPQVKATYSSTNTEHKTEWENNYGNDGYVILAPGDKKGAFYSNMYGEENVGTKIQGTESNGFVYLSGTPNRYMNDADISSEVICKWGATSSLWQSNTNDFSLYAPGTTTGVGLRFHDDSKGENGNKYNDTSMFFRTVKAETYVTVYVADYNRKVSASNPIKVEVLNTAQNFHNSTSDGLTEWYGAQSALSTATVTSQSSYVTFKLEGVGDYQIVAYDANATAETEGVTLPSVTGLFFDSIDRNKTNEIDSWSLSLEGDIGVNVYMNIANAADVRNFTFEYANGTTSELSIPETTSDGTYKFTARIAAKDYAKDINMWLTLSDGTKDCVTTISVKKYIDTVLENQTQYDSKLVSLISALDDYCKYTATYFSGGELAATAEMEKLTAADFSKFAWECGELSKNGVEIDSITLLTKSKTILRLYFTASELPENLTINGNKVNAVSLGNGRYYIETDGVNSNRLDETVTFVIGAGDNAIAFKASALTYAAMVIGTEQSTALQNVAKAMYLYSLAANAYFNK